MFLELLQAVLSNLLYFALHLQGKNSFPKPLSATRERECFLLAAEGDQSARSEIIEHNLRLVAHIARKYTGDRVDQEDLLSIGTIGLIKAVDTFSVEKGSRFATYAARCIENEILMHFRAIKKTSGEFSINDPLETDKDGNPLTLMDLLADEQSLPELVDLRMESERLYRSLGELSARERLIVVMRYGLYGQRARTQREVAKALSISRSYVSRIEKKALARLKESLQQ